jgi:plastocyanin
VTNSVGVSTGSDGNLWVTQGDAGDIVKLDTAGNVLQTYPTHPTPATITIGPDGNMWFASLLDGEIGRLRMAEDGVAYVLDIAPGFVPAARTVELGTTVKWVLEAPGKHSVRDRSGLGLYDSGPQAAVSFLIHAFDDSGTYPYDDVATGDQGKISVPVTAPTTAISGVPFDVTWALGTAPPGMARDVQVQVPGSSTWLPWQTAVATGSAQYTAEGGGTYSFRARLRGAGSGATGWSPPVAVTVS